MKILLSTWVMLAWLAQDMGSGAEPGRDRVRLTADHRAFILTLARTPFVPWGFNYDHDEQGRLIEDYWEAEWATVEAHFGQMKKLGANVVRIHLQFGKFMDAAGQARTRRRWTGSASCSSWPRRSGCTST